MTPPRGAAERPRRHTDAPPVPSTPQPMPTRAEAIAALLRAAAHAASPARETDGSTLPSSLRAHLEAEESEGGGGGAVKTAASECVLPRAPFLARGAAEDRIRALRAAIERQLGSELSARLYERVQRQAAGVAEEEAEGAVQLAMTRASSGGAAFVAVALMERLVYEEERLAAAAAAS